MNNLAEQYLIFAEGQAMRRVPMYMKDWVTKLDGFLSLNDREILTHAGKISHKLAMAHTEQESEKFHREQIQTKDNTDGEFEKAIKLLVKPKK